MTKCGKQNLENRKRNRNLQEIKHDKNNNVSRETNNNQPN